jgi:hypothetical protein
MSKKKIDKLALLTYLDYFIEDAVDAVMQGERVLLGAGDIKTFNEIRSVLVDAQIKEEEEAAK